MCAAVGLVLCAAYVLNIHSDALLPCSAQAGVACFLNFHAHAHHHHHSPLMQHVPNVCFVAVPLWLSYHLGIGPIPIRTTSVLVLDATAS